MPALKQQTLRTWRPGASDGELYRFLVNAKLVSELVLFKMQKPITIYEPASDLEDRKGPINDFGDLLPTRIS